MPAAAISRAAVGSFVLLVSACATPSSTPPATQPLASAAGPVEFRVVPTDQNPSSCQRWDAELARVHTVTRTGDGAVLRTAGGITRTMTMTAPNVFTTTMAIGGINFNVVADASTPPGTLDISEPRTGCRWSAIAR